MKRAHDPRPLLLEQLETRQMLAGGLSSPLSGPTLHDRAHPQVAGSHAGRDHAIAHATRVIARQDQHVPVDLSTRLDRHNGPTGRPGTSPLRVEMPSLAIGVPLNVAGVAGTGRALQDAGEARVRSPILDAAFVVIIDFRSLPVVAASTGASSARSDGLLASTNVRLASSTRSFRSAEIESNPKGSSGSVEKQQTDANASISKQASPEAFREAREEVPGRESNRAELNRPARAETWYGTTIPSSRPFAIHPPSLRNASDWEIDAESLQRLREVLREDSLPETSDQEASDDDDESKTLDALNPHRKSATVAEPVDEVITNWFADADGWVELDDVGSMPFSTIAQTPEEIVDVALKATLGLHQGIELIASEWGPASTDACRHQVLAVLAEEMSQADESIDPAPVQASTVAYSAAAAVAGALAAAGRRRKVLMYRTVQTG